MSQICPEKKMRVVVGGASGRQVLLWYAPSIKRKNVVVVEKEINCSCDTINFTNFFFASQNNF